MAQDHVAALPKGYQLKEYVIERVLGQGAFGITYLALDSHLNTWVAIKEYLPDELAVRDQRSTVMPKSTASRSSYVWGLERFFSEAQTVARFNHPNIVRVLRLMRENGTAYIVMPYERGRSLGDHLGRLGRPLREGEMLALLQPLMDGLAAVHAEDVLHRDLKPGNIFLRNNGTPVLLDFGSARQAVRGERQDMTSVLTPGYAPIEQYADSSDQGPWTDIYALGAIFYRCLTGKTPVDATRRSEHLLNKRPDPLISAVHYAAEHHAGAYGAPLLQAIDTALAITAGDRPQSIDDLRALLGPLRERTARRSVIDPPTTPPMEATVAERTGTGSVPGARDSGKGRRSALVPILGVIGTLAVSVAALGPWMPWSPFRPADPMPEVPQTATVTGPDTSAPDSGPPARDIVARPVNASGVEEQARPPDDPIPNDPTDALAGWRARAEGGDVAAQRHLGESYRDGVGTTQDFREAVHWFRQAAETGDSEAQVQLALMVREGMGIRRDLDQAHALLEQAAEQWHPGAAFELGRAYRDGTGVEADSAIAVRWFRRAAEQGDAGAMLALGRAYEEGAGVARNPATSLSWLQNAAAEGAGEAAIEISRLYASGLGVERDLTEAVRWAAGALNSEDGKTAREAAAQLAVLGDSAWTQAAYRLLLDAGYQPGPERPWPSQDLRSAIRAFQRDRGAVQTGEVTVELLGTLANQQ